MKLFSNTFLPLIGFILILTSCSENDSVETVNTELPYSFEDGFEVDDGNLSSLFLSDGSRWTNIQQVNPNNGENLIALSNDQVSEGNNSLRIVAAPSDNILSKMGIEKAGFFAPNNSRITIEADIYINSTENLKDLFLIDLECCSCWDNSVPDNQCPGIRLIMSGENNYLSIERGKILDNTIIQTNTLFPEKKWVKIVWKIKLSEQVEGENILIIDGQEVINESGVNLPNPDRFRNEFARNGIDFKLEEPLGYERIQIGATANPTVHQVELFLDNFKLSIE